MRRAIGRGAAATSAAAVPFLAMAAPASAFELYAKQATLEHRFTDFAGGEVTCVVEYISTLSRPDSSTPFVADTSTEARAPATVPDEACRAAVFVDTVYRDPTGAERHAHAFGEDVVGLRLDEVQGTYTSTHRVIFLECTANCEAVHTSSPK
jgi:hypothetical protein